MVYDRLNSAVDGLALGNGTVYNFINYIGRIHLTGGIARYTLNRGYFFNNISSNYEGGLVGRYGYGTYDTDLDVKDKIDGGIGHYVKDGVIYASKPAKDRVGDFYTISGPLGNSERKFTTTDEFSLLGSYSLVENAKYNVDEDTFESRFKPDNDYKFLIQDYSTFDAKSHTFKSYVPKSSLGDESVNVYIKDNYTTLFGGRRPLDKQEVSLNTRIKLRNQTFQVTESQGIDTTQYVNFENGIKNVSNEDDFTWKRNGKITRDIINQRNRFLFGRNLLFTETPYSFREFNSFFRNLAITSSPYGNSSDYGDEYEKKDEITEVKALLGSVVKNTGLYSYYDVERATYSVDTSLKKRNVFWYGRSYGVKTDGSVERYGVGDGIRASKATVDPEFKAGTFRTNQTNSATYSYYQENDGAPVTVFGDTSNTPIEFTPTIDSFNNASRLMKKMNEKFVSNDIRSLVNRFHTSIQPEEVNADDQLISSYTPEYGLSRGRNLLKANHDDDNITGFNNPYCRVWTAHYQYSKMKDRIRPFMNGDTFRSIAEVQASYGRMRPNNGAERLSNNSVLMDNGFVKITPLNDGGSILGGKDSVKRYMFSIENLAWKDFAKGDRLSDEQIGTYGGRIMWFPPYNLKFTENVNVDWKQHEFIGRGEKIYTYANTERGGTLDFTLLIDHPAVINKAVNEKNSSTTDDDILRFFAGCGDLSISDDGGWNKNDEKVGPDEDEPSTTPMNRPQNQFINVSYIMFYPNNFSAKKYQNNLDEMIAKIDKYEMSTEEKSFIEMDDAWSEQKLAEMNYDNISKYNLNAGKWDEKTKSLIASILNIEDDIENYHPYSEFKNLANDFTIQNGDGTTLLFGVGDTRLYEIDKIETRGFASDHGYAAANETLSKDRAVTMQKMAMHLCSEVDFNKMATPTFATIPVDNVGGVEDVNALDAKIARSSIITFRLKLKDDVTPSITNENETVVPTEDTTQNGVTSANESGNGDGTASNEESIEETAAAAATANEAVIVNEYNKSSDGEYYHTYQNEFLYFKMLEATDPLVHKKIVDKVKFFNPAFHSLTPEGFNARLNFLHQCTRQGPTIGSHSGGQNSNKSPLSRMAGNMSFGMAPYCILRIGDFYYSKIVIDSISINYDNGGQTQWDLNPEGAGVQPMMANVNMSFKFIGGQDIEGPVEQLQNALSYNYYANSSIYTPETQSPMPQIIDNK